jgi:hypothetical protein
MAIEFTDHSLMQEDWIGVVHNATDPTFSGRAQIKVFGILDEVKEEHLPWATPTNSTIFAGNGAGSMSVPKVGMFVRVHFNNGDLYAPEYTVIQNVDSDLINRIKADYAGTHVLLYDPSEELTVIYQKLSGFQIYHKESFIQITPDSMITLQTPDNESIIQLDGDITRVVTKNEVEISAAAKATVSADEVIINGAQTTKIGPGPTYYHAVRGEPLIALLSTLATALDNKLPATPGVNYGLCEAAKQAMLSTNVLIGG